MRGVLVTGAESPLGRHVLAQLRRTEGAGDLYGAVPRASEGHEHDLDDVGIVSFSSDYADVCDFLVERSIDTVVHCGLAPDRGGDVFEPVEARVIDTMRLAAAISRPNLGVRSLVVVSSSAVYSTSSQSPLLQREDGSVDLTEGTLSASIAEAEEYVRDVADRCPHLNVSILRLQQLVGPDIRSPLTEVLRQRVLPSIIGFDAPLQMLSIEDATRAIVFAAKVELAGVYNVASSGTLRISAIARELGRPRVPVLPIEAGLFAGIARATGVPFVPNGMLSALTYGHALDTSKIAAAGFEPEYDQAACLDALRDT